MNTMTNDYRMELRGLQKGHPLFRETHPFWRDFFRGRLPLEAVQRWAVDVYPLVRDFSRWYLHVAARCESERILTFLAETIYEETGSGKEAESHPTLFRKFMKSLKIAEDAIPAAPPTEAGGQLHAFAWETVREGSFLEGLALVGLGIERPLPHFFDLLARAFQRRHGLDHEAVTFFTVHTVADVKHSQLAARIVAELAATTEQRQAVQGTLTRLWNLQQRQLDELHGLRQD